MKDLLEDSEILHGDESRDVEWWLDLGTNLLCMRLLVSYSLLLFYFSYLCGCSSSLISLLAFHPSLTLSVYTISTRR